MSTLNSIILFQSVSGVHLVKQSPIFKMAHIFAYKPPPCSVGEQEDIEGLALETDCLPRYVAKGIALGCFVFARCLHHGLRVEKNREQAKRWYSRVSLMERFSIE